MITRRTAPNPASSRTDSVYTAGLQAKSPSSHGLISSAYTAALQTAIPTTNKVVISTATGAQQAGSPEYKLGTDDPAITPDPGAGQWNSKPWTSENAGKKAAILYALSLAYVSIGDDAAKHMLHYLMNSGKDFIIDLQGMINDLFSAKSRMIEEILQALDFVQQLPTGSYNITSKRANVAEADDINWFLATGGYLTWGKGIVTITQDKSVKHYRLYFSYHFYDRYNWDKGKAITIGDIEITDEEMGEFHRQGLAQEFDLRGVIKREYSWTDTTGFPSNLHITTGR